MASHGQVATGLLLTELERLRFSGDVVDFVPYGNDLELAIIQPPARFYELLKMLNDTEEEGAIGDREDMLDFLSESDGQGDALDDLPGEEGQGETKRSSNTTCN